MKEFRRRNEPPLTRRDFIKTTVLAILFGAGANHLRRVVSTHSIQTETGFQPDTSAEAAPKVVATTQVDREVQPKNTKEYVAKPNEFHIEEYNRKSEKMDSVGEGAITWYKRQGMNYVVAYLDTQQVMLYPMTAHDTGIEVNPDYTRDWSDGKPHLEAPSEMAKRNMHLSNKRKLVCYVPTDYFGEPNTTYPEGPFANVELAGGTFAANPQRPGICMNKNGTVDLHYLSTETIQSCNYAFGGGPFVVYPVDTGEIIVADPSMPCTPGNVTPINGFGCFNQDQNYFANIETRKSMYLSNNPQAMSGVGMSPDGRLYFVVATSDRKTGEEGGITGLEMAKEMRQAGCAYVLLHDSNSQVSFLWYGMGDTPQGFEQDPVPTGVGIYLYENS